MRESLIDKLKSDNINVSNDSRPMEHYKAYSGLTNKKRQTRLNIKRKGDVGTLLYYPYINTVEYSGSELITIFYYDSVINLKGTRLDLLIEPLQDENIRYLQEFDPKVHTKLLDEKKEKTIIEQIEFISMKELAE